MKELSRYVFVGKYPYIPAPVDLKETTHIKAYHLSIFIYINRFLKQILKRKYNIQKFHKTHAGNSNENSISKSTFD